MGLTKTKTALLIDDDQGALIPFRIYLRGTNFRLVYKSDPGEALKYLKKNRERVDIVFLDLLMPDMGGLEFLDQLRGMPLRVPVVIVSGEDRARAAVEALKRGASDYITKPIIKDQLYEKLSHYVAGFEKAER